MGVVERAVLTFDVVDFSQINTNEKQLAVIQALIDMLRQAIPNHQIGLWSPAGDGGSFTFLEDNNAAVFAALKLGELLNEYNKTPGCCPFDLRTGIHIGPVYKEIDFDGRENVWGNGVNISARVASLARKNQILISDKACESLGLRNWPGLTVTAIGKRWAKHQLSLDLYNIYDKQRNVGTPPSDLEEWYGPFHYPLQQAIDMYEAMLEYQTNARDVFRTLMVAKRLLDLRPKHRGALKTIKSISREWQLFEKNPLYHGFFSGLSPSALVYFFQHAEFSDYPRDQIIAKEGDKADSLMMVVSGEIVPTLEGKRLQEVIPSTGTKPEDAAKAQEIVISEGDIVGEMGLFNPGGRRGASLVAHKSAITLTLAYRFLDIAPGTPDNEYRLEIRKQIWTTYCYRMRQNAISRDPLLTILPEGERGELLPDSKFLPIEPGEPINLTVDEVWRKWIIVMSGQMTVYTGDGKAIIYGPAEKHNCFGSLRVVKEECPFSKVELAPNTQLVYVPWDKLLDLMESMSEFSDQCAVEGNRDNMRYRAK